MMDGLTTRTIAFHHGRAEEFTGNYSSYETQLKERQDTLRKQKVAQDREIAKTEQFINRFRAQANKASQVQSRIKQLAKIERIEIDAEDAVMSFRFPDPPASTHLVAKLEKAANPTRETFAVTGPLSPLTLYNLDSLTIRGMLPATRAKEHLRLHVSNDSSLVAFYHWPRSVEIGRINEGWQGKLPLSKGHISALTISPDNKLIASGGSEDKVFIHNIATGLPIRILTGHRKRIKCLAFSPESQTLVSSSDDFLL